jgi:hypothetical protein
MYSVGGAHKDLNFRVADVKQLDFGESHLLVLKTDGRIFSWGAGAHGQLGIGAKGTAFQKEDLSSTDLYLVWPLENVRVKQVSPQPRCIDEDLWLDITSLSIIPSRAANQIKP